MAKSVAQNTVGKNEFIQAMMEAEGYNKKEAEAAFEAFMFALDRNLQAGNKVQLQGLITVDHVLQEERESRNPKTGETFTTPAKHKTKVTLGSKLESVIPQPK